MGSKGILWGFRSVNLGELLRVNRLEINTKTEQKTSFEIVQSMTERRTASRED